jgi:soluble lytic murein transglycosylase-like protein
VAVLDHTAPAARRVGPPRLRHDLIVWLPVLLGALLTVSAARTWSGLWQGLLARAPVEPAAAVLSAPMGMASSDAGHTLPVLFTDPVRHWSEAIVGWSAAYDLPADLVAVVMQLESCGYPGAVSAAGAQGLFQVMPYHFAPGEDAFDPQANARRGLAYLARSLDLASNQVDRALAGYNGGHGVIPLSPSAWPAETQRYVAWGTGILRDVERGLPVSPTLEAWLQAGGQRLCRRAEQALAGEA